MTTAVLSALISSVEARRPVALATVTAAPDPAVVGRHAVVWLDSEPLGSLGLGELEAQALADARDVLRGRVHKTLAYTAPAGPVKLFVEVQHRPPELIIVGAGHVAQPLAAIGGLAGMRVCVVDDRAEWANRERFPTADEIAVVAYEPVHEILAPLPFPMTPATYVVVTTWGYDLPAMAQALQQAPAYIGLVASPTKTRVLFKRLREAGFADEAVRRIRAPVGLDVGAENPGEIAVSILAEILAVRHGRSGQPLGQVRGARAAALFARPADLPAVVPAGLAEPR